MEMNEEHGKTIQSSAEHAEQRMLQAAASTPWKSAETHTAKRSPASQDCGTYQPSHDGLRCPENIPMQVAGQQQHVHACTSMPLEHSPARSLEAIATTFSADTPDELELDGDDSVPCAQQAQHVQQAPFRGIPDRSATHSTTGKPHQAPLQFDAGQTTVSAPPGVLRVSTRSAPSGCLLAVPEWQSRVGEASGYAAAQTTPTGLVAAQDVTMHKGGPVIGPAIMEQGNGPKCLSRDISEPCAKKPRTLQPDMESRHAAQESDGTNLARDPHAKDPCTAQPDAESKATAAHQCGTLATSTNAGDLLPLFLSKYCLLIILFASACTTFVQIMLACVLLPCHKDTSCCLSRTLFTL